MSKDDKDKKGEPAPSKVDPVPKRPEFFEWLEKLFFGETQFPEKLTIRIVTGKHGERDGPMIKQIVYSPGEHKGIVKPSREKIVALSNEILALCQERSDQLRKTIQCGIFASHFAREVEYYESKVLRFAPRDNQPRAEGEEDEEEPKTLIERGHRQAQDHLERIAGVYIGGVEGVMDRMDRIVEREQVEIVRVRAENASLQEQLQRALDLKEDRDARREWRLVGTRGADRAVNMAIDLAPTFIARLTGTVPKKSPEAIALERFFTTTDKGGYLTTAQADAAFGVWDGDRCTKPGVLTREQGETLYRVSTCELPAEKLYDLMPPDGKYAITLEQVGRLQNECGFDAMTQLAPLMALFQSLQARRQTAVAG